VDCISFEYDGHFVELTPAIPPGTEQYIFYVYDYPVPFDASSVNYQAHISDTEGYHDFTAEDLELHQCSNSRQDP